MGPTILHSATLVVLLLQLQSSLLGEPDLTITAEQLIAKGAVHQYRYLYHLRDTIEGYPGIWLVTVSRKPGSLGYMEWFHRPGAETAPLQCLPPNIPTAIR